MIGPLEGAFFLISQVILIAVGLHVLPMRGKSIQKHINILYTLIKVFIIELIFLLILEIFVYKNI